MYEDRCQPPVRRLAFFLRVAAHLGVSMLFGIVSLGVGMAGYEHFEHLDWCDAFLNAAMLLGGMGPVETPATRGGKIFAGLYALYSGLFFLISAGIVLAPVFHRLMHKFHWHDGEGG
jgi:hypothetical protein